MVNVFSALFSIVPFVIHTRTVAEKNLINKRSFEKGNAQCPLEIFKELISVAKGSLVGVNFFNLTYCSLLQGSTRNPNFLSINAIERDEKRLF